MRSVKLYQLNIDIILASNLRVWWLINHSQVERAMRVLSSEMIPYHKPQTKHNSLFSCCCSLFHITPSELHMSSLAFPSNIMCRCHRESQIAFCFLQILATANNTRHNAFVSTYLWKKIINTTLEIRDKKESCWLKRISEIVVILYGLITKLELELHANK